MGKSMFCFIIENYIAEKLRFSHIDISRLEQLTLTLEEDAGISKTKLAAQIIEQNKVNTA